MFWLLSISIIILVVLFVNFAGGIGQRSRRNKFSRRLSAEEISKIRAKRAKEQAEAEAQRAAEFEKCQADPQAYLKANIVVQNSITSEKYCEIISEVLGPDFTLNRKQTLFDNGFTSLEFVEFDIEIEQFVQGEINTTCFDYLIGLSVDEQIEALKGVGLING